MVKANEEMVDCYHDGVVTHIPKKIFMQMVMRTQIPDKKYVRYKEGAEMYSMSERQFFKLAHDANAVIKYGKLVLINVEIIDRYLEYFRIKE